MLKAGIYRHYKGGYYLLIGIAKMDGANDRFAVYVPLHPYPGCVMTIRPLREFTQTVEIDGLRCSRFRWVGEVTETAPGDLDALNRAADESPEDENAILDAQGSLSL